MGLLVGLVALAWLAGREPGAIEVRWSPYQKLVLREGDPHLSGLSAGCGRVYSSPSTTPAIRR